MGKQKLKDLSLNRLPLSMGVRNEYEEFAALFKNSIRVINTSYPQEQRIKNLILDSNYVGYDGIVKLWTGASPTGGRTKDNLPQTAIFYYSETNRSITRRLSYSPAQGGAYLIQGIPSATSYREIIQNHTDLMYECDIAIMQNIRATKTPYWIAVQDPKTRLSIEHAIQQQQQGYPVIVTDATLIDNMKGITVATPITFPELYEFRQKIRSSLLNKLSTLTSNRDKLERVQSAEISAGVGECEDYIYALIDNFNKQAKSYGLIERMELNSSLEELYTQSTIVEPEKLL